MLKTPCKEWTGKINAQGYGVFRENGKTIRAHRRAYEDKHGPIPDGMFVLHECDNRKCWNDEHLHLGTHQDNMKEMTTRKRSASGDRCGRSKLTDAQVEEIRKRSEAGELRKTLAAEFGVHYLTIGRIMNGKSRKG